MTWSFRGNGLYTCLSSDTKVTTGVTAGSACLQVDDGKTFYFSGGAWTDVTSGGGGGSGATNLEGLTDVDLTSPVQYHVLQYGAGTDFINALIDNNNIAASAGIAKSKLAALAIANTDVAGGAAIDWSKINKTGSALGDIDNINLSGLANGDSIKWDSGTAHWIVYTPGTGGSGEANTASNFGTAGTGVVKDKDGVDLRFYKLNSVDNKLTIGLDGTDKIDFTVNQANLTLSSLGGTLGNSKISDLAYSKLTSVPSTFAPSAHTHAGADIDSGTVAVARLPVASESAKGIAELATSAETTAGLVVQASDTRLSDSRAPTTHNHAAADINSGTLAVAQGGLNKSSITQHALLKGGASNAYSEIAVGTENHVLAVVSGTPAWKSLDSERTGKAVASGNASTTVFNIAHGLGATPGYAFVDCSSHTITRTWIVNSTNIVVTFSSAPPTGTNNVIIYWRVIAS